MRYVILAVTHVKGLAILTKEQMMTLAANTFGAFYRDSDFQDMADLDGTHIAELLTSKGFTVLRHYDTGRCGIAITKEGLVMTTNGYFHLMVNTVTQFL